MPFASSPDRAIVTASAAPYRLLIAEYPDLTSLARPLTGEAPEDVLPAEVIADLAEKTREGGR